MSAGLDDALADAPLRVRGRIMPASNQTFLAELEQGERVVYKPIAGERPLWDFADGTLALREYAAWLVSEALGWSVVPRTVLREGPLGLGMVQRWIEYDDPDPHAPDPVEVVASGRLPDGYLHVLDATDERDRPVALVHEDNPALRRMAIFDVIVNNTDRKGGHVLRAPDGHRHGVDHGICFHTDDKLRTVLWGWSGEPIAEADLAAVSALADRLVEGPLREDLQDLLTAPEIAATVRRCRRLLAAGRLPVPAGGWPSIPWPPF